MRRENSALPGLKGDDGLEQLVLWLRGTRNDLEAPALSLAPEIGRALGQLQMEGAMIARMSGSGATCFGIFETGAQAGEAAAAIAARHPGWFVRATESITPAMEASHA
jgi:4-diphosphocytidyl-2-C-methyl-D-erythritol kinase